MRERLLAVAMTYWTRPLVWVLGLAWLCVIVSLMFIAAPSDRMRACHPEVEMPRGSVQNEHDLERVRSIGQQAEVRGLEADRLRLKFDGIPVVSKDDGSLDVLGEVREPTEFQKILDEFPKLRALTVPHALVPADLEELGEQRHLQQLSMADARVYRPGTPTKPVGTFATGITGDEFKQIAKLRELEVLDLRGADLSSGLQHLSELPRLHTLIISPFEQLTDADLAELRQLPQLRTLVFGRASRRLRGEETTSNHRVIFEGLKSLAEIRSLRTVSVFQGEWYDRISSNHTVSIDELRALLPHVRVQRGSYDDDRVTAAMAMPIFASFLLSMLLGLHTLSLAAQATGYLLPRYSPAQLMVPVLWQVVTVAGLTVGLVKFGAELLPSVCSASTFLCAFLWFAYLCMSHIPRRQNLSMRSVQGMVTGVGFVVPISLLGSRWLGPWIDAFLLGDAGFCVPSVITLLSVAGLSLWNIRLPNEAQRFGVVGSSPVLSFADFNQASTATAWKRIELGKSAWLFQRSDRFLEQAVHQTEDGLWSQVHRWRAGVSRMGVNLLIMSAMFSLMGLVSVIGKWTNSVSFATLDVTAVDIAPTVMYGLFGLIMLPHLWRARMPGMAGESLLPMTRGTLRQVTFLSVLADAVPAVCVSFGWLLVVGYLCPPAIRTPTSVLSVLTLWLTSVGLLYAATMWYLLIRKLWLSTIIWAATIMTVMLLPFVFALLTQGTDWNPAWWHLPMLAICAMAFMLLALSIVWRRWGTVEFGVFDR